ncbi:hypothetical protein ACJRO7_024541 [Eucalyptus globulus]|uniref:Uncharacterized protein n=1 Tax=Eucalyptus globulus TaxID=34317 RepID=A0ABD3KBT7_EUCGL
MIFLPSEPTAARHVDNGACFIRFTQRRDGRPWPPDLPRGARTARWPGPGSCIIECPIGDLHLPPLWARATLGFAHVSAAPGLGHASVSWRGGTVRLI